MISADLHPTSGQLLPLLSNQCAAQQSHQRLSHRTINNPKSPPTQPIHPAQPPPFPTMGNIYSQTFPPPPSLTATNLPPQTNKIFLVTGGASGIGFELTRILYSAGAKVYLAGRSEPHALAAIQTLTGATPSPPPGAELHFLPLDLSNLSTIPSAAALFQSWEPHLDVLWNNAGTGPNFSSPLTAEGLEPHLATNCLGPFLFTLLLLPSLHAAGNSRVVWTTSMLIDTPACPSGGIDVADLAKLDTLHPNALYTLTKVGNWFLAAELGRREKEVGTGVVSVAQNPGNCVTEVWRHQGWWMRWALRPVLYDARCGAWTELWAGLGEGVGDGRREGVVVPWGRWHSCPREDLVRAIRGVEEGGEGRAERFWEWCERMTEPFVEGEGERG